MDSIHAAKLDLPNKRPRSEPLCRHTGLFTESEDDTLPNMSFALSITRGVPGERLAALGTYAGVISLTTITPPSLAKDSQYI